MKCEHEYVETGHKNTLMCIKCKDFFMQAVIPLPKMEPFIKPDFNANFNVMIENNTSADLDRLIADRISENIQKSIIAGVMGN